MVNEIAFEKAITIIENIIKKDKSKLQYVFKKELIDCGKMTNLEVSKILSLENIEEFNINILVWIYQILEKYNDNIPAITEFFTDLEISNANTFLINRYQSAYPVKFKFTKLSDKNEYKFILSIQEINSLMKSGNIVLIEGMQRESDYTMYGDRLVSHVAYNDNVAREISNSMVKGEYWCKDDIAWHLIEDENLEYTIDESNNEIIIKNGTIALLDGQHRSRAIEYALLKNEKLNLNMGIYLTIGTIEDGQHIIAQHEKQQPINKRMIKTYEKSVANDIFRMFSNDNKIKRRYKFVDTLNAEKSGLGFGVKSDIIKSIEQNYDVNNMSITEQEELSDWLVEFYIKIYSIFENDINNFIIVRKNRWNVKTNAFYLYTMISKIILDNKNNDINYNVDENINRLLSKVDFKDKTLYNVLTNKQSVINILNK